jgi:ubiquinone/menaquinone biosynthesis C-methylase UbiE
LNVVFVEPNAEMLAVAECDLPQARCLIGTAEATGLDPDSVDLITVAQAFHWFDLEPTKREFERVLRSGGNVVLVWNVMSKASPASAAVKTLLKEYSKEVAALTLDHRAEEDLDRFFAPGTRRNVQFRNTQILSQGQLSQLMYSRSYMPRPDSVEGAAVQAKADAIFEEFSREGRLEIEYSTEVVIGKLLG